MEMSESIKDTFSVHHEEIQRRSMITQQGLHDSKTFSKVENVSEFAFYNEEQKFIVFSLSHESFAPIAEDVANPGVCIYGGFPSRDEAMEYARTVMQTHTSNSIFIDEIHKWVVGASNPVHLTDADFIKKHTENLLSQHQAMIHANLKEFEENVEKKKVGHCKEKNDDEEESTASQATKRPEARSHKIHGSLDVRGQKVLAVSFVKDSAEVPQFLMRVYGFFENETDANVFVRNTCGEKVQDFDVDIVSSCSWVFPQRMTYEHANKEVFRSEELDKIMQNHRNQPREVERFKQSMDSY